MATEDGSADSLLSLADGTLVLEDSHIVLGTLRPLKSFGASAFGPLRLRAVSENGERGDWQPLAKLVRVPSLKEVRCPDSPDKPCTLIGAKSFPDRFGRIGFAIRSQRSRCPWDMRIHR